jgi:hypothetical protein
VFTSNGGDAQSQPDNESVGGGIGDGAEPLPGPRNQQISPPGTAQKQPKPSAQEWKSVRAVGFGFSVPGVFVDNEVRGTGSEAGKWSGVGTIEVLFGDDWYSGSFGDKPGAENEPVECSGIFGERTTVRDAKQVEVCFGEVMAVLFVHCWARPTSEWSV